MTNNNTNENKAGKPKNDTNNTVIAFIGTTISKLAAITLKPYSIKKLNNIFLNNNKIFFNI